MTTKCTEVVTCIDEKTRGSCSDESCSEGKHLSLSIKDCEFEWITNGAKGGSS